MRERDEEGGRRAVDVALTAQTLMYFVKMFYYYFVMSKVAQRSVFWLWKEVVSGKKKVDS